MSAKAGRVTSVLEAGKRLLPEDFDDHDDVAHHYEATLKPSLADLDPAQNASAISGYVSDIGFAPDEAIKTAGAFFGDSAPGADRPNPALLQLVSAKNTGVQTDAQPDVQADTTGENDTAPTDVTEDTEGDEDEFFFDEENDGAEQDGSAFFSDLSDEDDAADGEFELSQRERGEGTEPENTSGIHLRVLQRKDDNRFGIFDGSTLIGFAANSEERSRVTDALKAGDPARLAVGSKQNDAKTPLGRVLNRITKAAAAEFDGDIGIGAETAAALQRAGILPGKGDLSPVRAFNDVLINSGAAAADLAFKALLALESGIIAGIGQTAQELGETPTFAKRLERDFAVLAVLIIRRGRPLKGRRSIGKIARQEATPSPTAEQLKSLGNFSERQRIQRLKPPNDFGRPGAFARMTPEDAFEGTRFPPRGPQENAFRGLAAVDLVIQDVLGKGPGIVDKAMRRSDLPGGQKAITFRWGKPGSGPEFRGGSGLSHIIAKHGIEVMEDVVGTVAKGKISRVPDKPDRLILDHGNTRAVLALIKDGKLENWVLTGFERGKPNLNFNLRELTGPVFFKGN